MIAAIRRFALVVVPAVMAALCIGEGAHAQASASPYTSATRYDALGRVTGTISPDPDGTGPLLFLAVRTTYDVSGRPTKVESGTLAAWQSDAVAPLAWTGFTVVKTVETQFDLLDRKVKEWSYGATGGTLSLTQYSYDAAGRLECTAVRMNPSVYASLPSSACAMGTAGSQGPDRITKNIYDATGQLLQVREGVGTSVESAEATYSYTANGKKKYVIDANGNKAELVYDGHDRQVAWIFPAKAAPPTGYNDATPANALTTAGAVASCTIGTIAEVNGVTSPSESRAANDDCEKYAYDRNGNRAKLIKRDGSVLAYSYDALGRMTVKDVDATSLRSDLASTAKRDVYYAYDLRGLQTEARFDSLSGSGLSTQYDGFGRVKDATQDVNGTARTLSYLYDANGNRTRVTHPDGVYFAYGYDGLNRLKTINYYNAAEQSFWGSQLQLMNYNTDGTLLSHSRTGNKVSYTYDPLLRLSSINMRQPVNGIYATFALWSYDYNPASQLASVSRTNDAFAWTSHANADRNYETNGLNQYKQTTASVGGAVTAAFCYDLNGNLTADGSSVYRYDIENRLVERRVQGAGNTNCAALSYAGTLQASIAYDTMGRLAESTGNMLKTEPGAMIPTAGTTRYLYDGDALVLEYGTSGSVLRRYVHGSDAKADDPLFWFEGTAPAWLSQRELFADHQGSIVATALPDGTLGAINRYDEYGLPQCPFVSGTPDCWANGANSGRFGYTGQAWLPELGMWYYKARIYSPTLGRFLQVDPIGYEDQHNLYAYVGGDPTNRADPTGMCGPCFLIIPATVTAQDILIGAGLLAAASAAGTAVVMADDGEGLIGSVTDESPWPSDPMESRATRPLSDLEPIRGPGHDAERPGLKGLTDDELWGTVENPEPGQEVKVRGNKVLDGNGRVKELQDRDTVDKDKEVPVEELPDDEPMAPWERDVTKGDDLP